MNTDVIYLYPPNDYRNYLAHHGVPGMHWGVRRYQNYDGTLTSAGKARIAKDGQGFKARMKIRGENFVNTHKDILRSTKAAKGIVNKASELVGHGRGETVARNAMYAQERLKNASKTRLGKHLHDVRAYNAKSGAEYHSIKRGQSLGERIVDGVVPMTAFKMPMKTITGRKTTLGMEVLTDALVGPIGTLTLSAGYHLSKGVRSSIDSHVDARSKESYTAAKASYDRSQKRIKDNESRKSAKSVNKGIKSNQNGTYSFDDTQIGYGTSSKGKKRRAG